MDKKSLKYKILLSAFQVLPVKKLMAGSPEKTQKLFRAGVIGSLYGALLAQADFDVSVYARGRRLESLSQDRLERQDVEMNYFEEF